MLIFPTRGPPSSHLALLSADLGLCGDLERGTVPGTFGMLNMGNGPERQALGAGGPVGPGTFANLRNFPVPAHRKWKETKQQPGTAGPGNMLGCCLLSFHFLWAIHPIRPVHVLLN